MKPREKDRGDDPRRPGGDISGPGGPYDRDSVIIDARNAVLLDEWVASAILEGAAEGDPPAVALMMEGRINRQDERTKIVYLMPATSAGALAAELVALAARAGEDMAGVLEGFKQALADLPT